MANKSRHDGSPAAAEDVARMEEDGATEHAVDPAPALADEIVELRKERDALHERLLRQAAEFDNYRKRVDRERKDASEYAAADLLQDVLPILDDFERALQVDAPGSEPYRQGLEIIHRALLELLRKRGVTAIQATTRLRNASRKPPRRMRSLPMRTSAAATTALDMPVCRRRAVPGSTPRSSRISATSSVASATCSGSAIFSAAPGGAVDL